MAANIIALVKKIGVDDNLGHHGVSREKIPHIAGLVGQAYGLKPEDCKPVAKLVEAFFE